jgi:cell division protein FtsB
VARRRRPARSTLALRWAGVAALALVGLLYYRPLKAYVSTHKAVAERRAEVRALQAQKQALEHRLAVSASLSALEREARRLGYVKPGEHLYIVKGIGEWRKELKARLGRNG